MNDGEYGDSFRTLAQLVTLPRFTTDRPKPPAAGNDARPRFAIVSPPAVPQLEQPDEGERDVPLVLRWSPDDTWLNRLGWERPNDPETARIEGAILAAAHQLAITDPGRWLSYSRRNDWYALRRAYLGDELTRRRITRAIDRLAAQGLIENEIAKANSYTRRQSRFRATRRLSATHAPTAAIPLPMPEPIMLRSRSDEGRGVLIDYRDTADTERMRRNLACINEMLAAIRVDLADDTPGLVRDGTLRTVYSAKGAPVTSCLALARAHRIFNGDFQSGGRFYADGGAWQSLPKWARARLTIDGERTVERDYEHLHPRMVYAADGLPLSGDAYVVPGRESERPHVKLAFNIMLNAERGRHAAVAAIAKKLAGEGRLVTAANFARARELAEMVERRHPALVERQRFYTGAGLRLQRADSDMAERVMLELIERGIPCLPIHDSFVVADRHFDALADVMDAERARMMDEIKGRRIFPGSVMQTTA